MRVSIRNLTKRFGPVTVLRDVSIEVADRELFFLLGPSGCGKTTLLRLIAGFYEPDAGELRFDDRLMNRVPPHQRNTGMVFQNYALWPHLTVAQNVAYGLEVRGLGTAEREQRVRETLEIVQMNAFADRSPAALSGGQQQRVALARALVIRPDVLLLDEPLSNLDAKLRLEMREEIRRIHDQTRITTIYVTHDQKESLSLADRMAVLHDGTAEQVGTPREVYRRPANQFVAEFIGETNWLEAEVASVSDEELRLRTDYGLFVAPPQPGAVPGQAVWLGFRPETVRIGPAATNELQATVSKVTYLGEVEQYVLSISSAHKIKVFAQNPEERRSPGATFEVNVRPANVFVVPRMTAPR
jgi:iron(III) transport system ATP-binding protein